jgi:hypothetical protein
LPKNPIDFCHLANEVAKMEVLATNGPNAKSMRALVFLNCIMQKVPPTASRANNKSQGGEKVGFKTEILSLNPFLFCAINVRNKSEILH